MIVPSGAVRVLVATRPVDFRKAWMASPSMPASIVVEIAGASGSREKKC